MDRDTPVLGVEHIAVSFGLHVLLNELRHWFRLLPDGIIAAFAVPLLLPVDESLVCSLVRQHRISGRFFRL